MKFYEYLIEKGKNEGIEKNIVGAVVVNEKNEILILTRKEDDFMGGIDELPSGNIESNEDIYSALTRELKEETNLDLASIISYINTFDYASSSGKRSRQYNFSVRVNKIEDIKLTEHSKYQWLNIEEARENRNITDEVKNILEIYNFNMRKRS
ncbi:MAG: NUDIX domain-containing protein [Clostridia bacterium]